MDLMDPIALVDAISEIDLVFWGFPIAAFVGAFYVDAILTIRELRKRGGR